MSEEKRDMVWLIVVLVVLIVVLPVLVWGMWGLWCGYMPRMMGFGWGFMFLIPLAFLVIIALGAYYLITEFMKTGRSPPGHSERALEMLKERYAKGEITREQYLKMKEDLES
jgi:putative membrane protein